MDHYTNKKDDSAETTLIPEFLSTSHTERFYLLLNRLSPSQQAAKDYIAAAFIISSTDEGFEKMNPYFTGNGFNTIEMFQTEDFSTSYRRLAEAAANLFGQTYETDLSDLISSLDHTLFHVLIQAMIIRKYGVDLS